MADVGARLREARERRGLSLREIGATTKISLHLLEAIERNDSSRLPGGIFNRGFVRAYAREVGLDPDEVAAEFVAQSGNESPASIGHEHLSGGSWGEDPATTPDLASAEADFEARQRVAAITLKLLLISAAVGSVVLFFLYRTPPPPPGAETPTTSHDDKAEIRDAAGEAGLDALDDEEPTGPDVPISDRPPLAEPESGPVSETPIALAIEPSGDCWVRLTVDGQVVLSRLVTAGEREEHVFRRTAILQVGDAEACSLSINRRPARPLGSAGRVRQVVLTAQNYEEFLQ